jgi:3-phenylpropionate/trans-cinnamate dioxygenase ferredoxin reductase component
MNGVVIVGAGQAGFQTAASLRMAGYEESITLIGGEPGLPYQRPPLSKAFMLGKQEIESAALRPLAFYEKQRIELVTGVMVTRIDGMERAAQLSSGRTLSFDALVLAVGARNRMLPVRGAELDGVCYLRSDSEAVEIRQRIESARDVVVIGGGFIGLELAAAARTLGKPVRVLEVQPRLMGRVMPATLSDFYRDVHRREGVEISLGVTISRIVGYEGKVSEIVLDDGAICPADVVLVGIGVTPNVELAIEAGLNVSNGIVADERLQTNAPGIYAIGDCVDHPNPFADPAGGGRVRLESVQNAVDQAKCVADAIVGRSAIYRAVPWFWTDQFDAKLQMAGLSAGCQQTVSRGEPEGGKFSLFYFRYGRLAAVDSVNRPADHMIARKLIASASRVTPEQAADLSVDLKMQVERVATNP